MATFNKAFVALAASNTPQVLSATSKPFFKLWIYPGISPGLVGGGLTANAAVIWIGKTSTEQTDPLYPTQTLPNGTVVSGFPVVYETQVNIVVGQTFPFDLANLYITGTINDGVYLVWT